MPSAALPSSFASAAASNNNNDSSARSSARQGDGGGFGDWSRRSNGAATQTFRRTSTATTTQQNQNHQRDYPSMAPSNTTSSVGTYVPPHINASRAAAGDTRYSRSQLLGLYSEQKDAGELNQGLDNLFVGDWTDAATNGESGSKWNRRDEQRGNTQSGPDGCWDRNGTVAPLGLVDMTEDEKELFSTSVNSPLKGPQQTGNREGTTGRKSSISLGSDPANAFALSSPAIGRPQNRRREPSESYPFPRDPLASPSMGREENQESGIFRRRTDAQDDDSGRARGEGDKDTVSQGNPIGDNVFGTLRRSGTNPLSAGPNTPSFPWSAGPNSQTLPAMGAFGAFGAGQSAGRRPDLGTPRESRFRNLRAKPSMDEESQDDEQVFRGLGRLEEDLDAGNSRQTAPSDTFSREPFGQESGQHAFGTPPRRQPNDDSGFSTFGQRSFANQDDGSDQYQDQSHEQMSPTFTNPYSSPHQMISSMRDDASDEPSLNNVHLPGLGNVQQEARRDMPARGISFQHDFGQPVGSGAASRGFPSLAGFGTLPGLGGNSDPWSTSKSRTGTPTRERPYGDMNDHGIRASAAFNSPGLSGPQAGAFGGIGVGRGSRLGSLLPNAMHDQTRLEQTRRTNEGLTNFSDSYEDTRRDVPSRDADSPFQAGRGKFEDFFGEQDKSRGQFSDELSQHSFKPGPGLPSFQQQQSGQALTGNSSQPLLVQSRQMVMPDRIRWIYRDPQGVVQGPWSGLEMHDWYRAGFFSPELLVKKLEDVEYEPLAQLIRRIGNSREPFLVPQMGIAHPTSAQGAGQWPAQNAVTNPVGTGASAQPPFAGSFPSFGTTLTADQQNALERRKQEEQYLMARQKEHLAHQQVLVRQMQGQQGLQHHSSAQSLNSQPSFGSISAPNGFQASPPQPMNPLNQGLGGFDPLRLGGRSIAPIGSGIDNLGQIREEDPANVLDHLDLNRQQQERMQYQDREHEGRSAQILAEHARQQQEQAEADARQQRYGQPEMQNNERVQEFHNLQNQRMSQEYQQKDYMQGERIPEHAFGMQATEEDRRQGKEEIGQAHPSLTEQIQKAATAKQYPATSAWAKPESIPPQSNSPLPAPAARRGGPSLAESLAAESMVPSQSPSLETPTTTSSLAPWAREQQETTQKQVSLKEIQEAEAHKAARVEQAAAAARRAALEREAATQPPPPAPGLPSSSTWGSGESPLVPTAPTNIAWAKSAAAKNAPLPTSVKKTLQQIQKEEEAAEKKKKAQAASAATVAGSIASAGQAAGGKRYAELAGKAATAASPSSPVNSAWTTVGASGKVKTLPTATGPVPAARSVSSTGLTPAATQVKKATPTVAAKTSLATAQQVAQDAFKNWAVSELKNDLNKGLQVDDFVNTLMNFPPDTEIITEVIHSSSHTIDSRHFAEEFVRRRGLADKGKMDFSTTSTSHPSTTENKVGNGWSAVARKGSAVAAAKEDQSSSVFKIVAAKKKGGKK